MRPVKKGDSPYTFLADYAEAEPYLERAIGCYCSYCEFPIAHVPQVEHIVSKSRGGSLTDWSNLLLACTYCNARKNAETTPANKAEYLWPDEENSAIAYLYHNAHPCVNTAALNALDPSGEAAAKAQKTYDLVGLGNLPTPASKDRRWGKRTEAYETAMQNKERLEMFLKSPGITAEACAVYIASIADVARGFGFYSVWYLVFQDYPEVLARLRQVFPGTNPDCYAHDGSVLPKLLQKELAAIPV